MSSTLRILFAPIGGAVVVALLWLALNGMPGNPQRGWLEREPWPISSLPACAAIAAVLCLLHAAGRHAQQNHNESLATAADRLRLQHSDSVVRSDLGEAAGLRVFSDWNEGRHRLFGRFEGLEVQMLDFTSVQSSASRQGTKPRSDSQTIIVIPLETPDWPVFEIHPRGLSTWMWDLLGCRGASFRFRDEPGVIGLDRAALGRFNRRYRVFVGFAQRVAEMAGLALGVPVGAKPAQEAELSNRFTMGTLRRFAETRGWTVESCGTHAAFWRSGKIIPAAKREAFLREATDLYRSLAAPAKDAADANLVIEAPEFDSSTLGRRMSGLIAGALVGMTAAVVICVPLLLAIPMDLAGVVVFAWPFVAFAFMALGAYCGARLAAAAR
ncbi:MAG: hypothetical protein KJ000_30450 [Pirellulaceae bacterium]|nr:hypothetical protein [Pirellulaceae bacterium]